MIELLFARRTTRRGLAANRRHRESARYRMLGERLEPRSMFAVTASVTSGTLNIFLGSAGDAAFLSYGGSSYTLTNGTGVPVSGSPFFGVTAAVSVAAGAGNQSFTFIGSTALPVSLTVDSAVEATSISTAINASGLEASTVSISSPAITLAADISTTGVQTYAGAVQLAGSPSLTSSNGAVTFNSTVDAYFDMSPQATIVTGTSPISVSVGDLNGDGKPDLAIANFNSASVSVLLNTTAPGATTPTYSPEAQFATKTSPTSVSIGDLNGDGKPDLAIANFISDSVSVLLNTTATGATTPTYANQTTFAAGRRPGSVSIGDLNGDGKLDLAIACEGLDGVSVLLNTTAAGATTPTFANRSTFATGSDPSSVSIGDLSGDGKPDLAVANFYSDSVSVLLNTTAPGATTPSYASQTTFATGSRPASVAIGDLNGDGKPDLAIANSESASVSVLLSTTAPGATTPTYANQTTFATGSGPKSVSIGDLNGDGKPDLAIANSLSNSVSVLLNTTAPGATTPTYANQTMFDTEYDPLSVSIGDFNGDGKPDLAIANFGSNSVSVLLNATTHGNLTVSSQTGTKFAAPVGGTTPLGSVTIARGPTSIGGNVTTDGPQTYGVSSGDVTLSADATLASQGAAGIGFAGAVDGGHNLQLSAVGGHIGFAQGVGNVSPLASLWINSADSVTATSSLHLDGSLPGALAHGLVIRGLGVNGVFMQAAGSTISNYSGYGVVLGSTTNSKLAGFTLSNNASGGLYAKDIQTGTVVSGNSIMNSPVGIYLDNAQGFSAANNQIQNSTLYGVHATGNSGGSSLTGNSLTGSSSYGILLSNATGLTVGGTESAGNTIDGAADGVLAIGVLTGTSFVGNTIKNAITGMYLAGAQGLSVSSNQIQNSSGIGIYASGNSGGSSLTGNSLSGTSGNGILLSDATGLTVGGAGIAGNTITGATNGLLATGTLTGTSILGSTIQNSSIGVYLSSAQGLSVSTNQIQTSSLYGLYATGASTNTSLTQNSISGINAYGMIMSEVTGMTVGGTGAGGNTISGVGNGLLVSGTLTGTSMIGNTVQNTTTGLYLYWAQGLAVDSNQFSNNATGLYATGQLTGTQFDGNTFTGNTNAVYFADAKALAFGTTLGNQLQSNTSIGLYAVGDSSGSVVKNNTISGNAYGMYLSAARNLTVKPANKVLSNTVFGLYASGDSTGTVVEDNTITGNGTNINTSTASGGTFQSV